VKIRANPWLAFPFFASFRSFRLSDPGSSGMTDGAVNDFLFASVKICVNPWLDFQGLIAKELFCREVPGLRHDPVEHCIFQAMSKARTKTRSNSESGWLDYIPGAYRCS